MAQTAATPLKGPHALQIQNYACHCLALKSYFQQPGDGRIQPHIPARDLVWSVVISRILRVNSFLRLEWLVHSPARAGLGLKAPFGDDALAYCTERMDPEPTRLALAEALHQAAAQRLLRRAVEHLGPRFADYVVGDGAYATAPFLHTTEEVGLPVVARLKENLPLLAAAVRARFDGQPPHQVFQEGDDRVEVWDADDFPPWDTLDWPAVRALRYRQHKPDGTVVQAEWITNFSIAKLGSLSFYRMAKSRWEIENGGFNDGKTRYGMEHICHHEPNSILIRLAADRTRHGDRTPLPATLSAPGKTWRALCPGIV